LTRYIVIVCYKYIWTSSWKILTKNHKDLDPIHTILAIDSHRNKHHRKDRLQQGGNLEHFKGNNIHKCRLKDSNHFLINPTHKLTPTLGLFLPPIIKAIILVFCQSQDSIRITTAKTKISINLLDSHIQGNNILHNNKQVKIIGKM